MPNRWRHSEWRCWRSPCVGDMFEHFKEHGSRYELVVVSRFHIAKDVTEALRKLAPDAKFVFDTVDLQFLRAPARGRAGRRSGAAREGRRDQTSRARTGRFSGRYDRGELD